MLPEFPHLFVFAVVVVALVALLGIAEKLVSLWRHTRRQPSIEETISHLATKSDLQAVVTRFDARVSTLDNRHASEIAALRLAASNAHSELFEVLRNQNASTNEQLHSMQKSMEAEFRALSKEIGRLQGKIGD